MEGQPLHQAEQQENNNGNNNDNIEIKDLQIQVYDQDGRKAFLSCRSGQKLLTVFQEQEKQLSEHGIALPFDGNCGGRGSCGRCCVRFMEGGPLPSHADRNFFTPRQLRDGMRLACTAVLRQDCAVFLCARPHEEDSRLQRYTGGAASRTKSPLPGCQKDDDLSGQSKYDSLLNNERDDWRQDHGKAHRFTRKQELTAVTEQGILTAYRPNGGAGDRKADALNDALIIAVDIGTTTVAMQLAEQGSGKVLVTRTFLNPGRIYGADVVSRIQAAVSGRQDAMQKALREALERGVEELLKSQGIRPVRSEPVWSEPVRSKSVQSEPVHVDPVQPESVQSDSERKRILDEGSDGSTGRRPVTVICAGNTAMSHLLAGTSLEGLAAAPFEPGDLSLRQISLAGYPALILPGVSAFVGGDIVAGLYACRMQENERLSLYLDLGTNGEMVLGKKDGFVAASAAAGPAFEGPADGGYGADRMAVIAQLLRSGVVDEDGLMQERYFETGITRQGITMRQQDIRQFQLAKAAMRCGIEELLREYGVSAEEVETVFLAGGFGYFLQEADAIRTGLLPRAFAGKVVSAGNAALAGALRYGMEQPGAQELEALTDSIRAVNLAQLADFGQHYMELLSFKQE